MGKQFFQTEKTKRLCFLRKTAMILAASFLTALSACALRQNSENADNPTMSDNGTVTASLNQNITMADGSYQDPNIPRTYTLSVNNYAPAVIRPGNSDTALMSIPGLLPETVTYYKTAYYGSFYDGVSYSYENGVIYLEITPDIDDAMLTAARIAFELPAETQTDSDDTNLGAADAEDLPKRGCYFSPQDAGILLNGGSSGNVADPDASEASSEPAAPAYINGDGSIDLTQNPILYIVDSDGSVTSYPVVTRRQTYDIPTLFLTTDMGAEITSKYEYVSGNFTVDGTTYDISIRGRGNTSWRYFTQKSYLLKFDGRVSFFGMIPSEKWVLVSTYRDPSLIRNCVAMDIAAFMDHLEYTPQQIPVDVYLNGEYLGIYTFSEKIDVDLQKINMFAADGYQPPADSGDLDLAFFLECGGDLMRPHVYAQEYFTTAHSPKMFFQYPELDEPYTEEFYYVYNYMNELDRALVRGEGYEDYIDMDSWVDWFIVMELTNNTDSAFWRSSFLYRRPGEKVMLGPVWDFDMAFGNFDNDNKSYAYWATAEQVYDLAQDHYMSYLYQSDDFMQAVQVRWDEVKEDLLAEAMDSVDRHAQMVAASRVYNNHVRGANSSEYQVEALRNFIQRRYDWIDMSLHMNGYNRHEAPYTVSDPVPEEELFPEGDTLPDGNLLPDGAAVPDINAVPDGAMMSDNDAVPNDTALPDNGTVPNDTALPDN